MKKSKIMFTAGLAMLALTTAAQARVHETYLRGNSIYIGAKLVVLSHDKDELSSRGNSNHAEFQIGRSFYDKHQVEMFYLLPTDIDDEPARFKSFGARYSFDIDLTRRWKLSPNIGFGQNTFSANNNSNSDWDMNYGLGLTYIMLDRSTSVGAGVTSYDMKADHLGGYLQFSYHF